MWAFDVVRNTCPQPPGREQRGLGLDQQGLAGFNLQCKGAADDALLVPDQVDGEELVEKMGAGADVLLIQGMKDRVSGAVRRGAGASGLVAAEVLALTAKGALVDLAVVETRERHPRVLELVDRRDGLPAHELDGVLVA